MITSITYRSCVSFLAIATLLVCSINAWSQSNDTGFPKVPITHNFTTFDYNGGIQNWDIKQNKQGFIYVANNFGLLEFDGESWRRYTIPDDTRTLSIYIDSEDRIYTGGQNQFGYFITNEVGELVFHSLKDQLPADVQVSNVWNIFEHDGHIFYNSDVGIFVHDSTGLAILKAPENGFIFRSAGRLYLHSWEGGLYEWINGDFEHLEGSEDLEEFQVAGIIPWNDSSILIFTSDGFIFRYWQGMLSPWNLENTVFLRRAIVNTVELLSDNAIALGTQNMGLVVMDLNGDVTLHLEMDKGLNSNTVYSLFEDDFKNLWLGLNNGISMIELGSPFAFINQSVGISGTGYAAELFNNELYLGTNTGLYTRGLPPNGNHVQGNGYSLVPNSEGQVYSIKEINNNLWMGHHRGSFLIRNGNAIQLVDDVGTWRFEAVPGNGHLLAGTYNGFDIYSSTGVFLNRLTEFNESSRLFKFENDTVLWMSHGYKGAFRLTLSKQFDEVLSSKQYGEENGFPTNLLINVFQLGNELIFTGQSGIYRYDEESDHFIHYLELEEQLGDDIHISNLSVDSRGNIYYIIGNQSIGMLTQSSFNEFEKQENQFRRINKYISDDLENISILDHKNVLIGAKEGFIHYDPTIPTNIVSDFQTYIRSIRILSNDSLIYNGSREIELDLNLEAEESSMVIDFAAPYFDGFEDLQYQYRLSGLEDDWSEWSSATHKEYTNIPEGDYTFEVRARNIYGDISETSSFGFQVYPPWYMSRLALTLYAAGVLVVFALILFWVDIRHRKDKRILEMSSQMEIQEKDKEIQSVSEQSERAIMELKNEKLQAEVSHKNKELASSTMHLVNKNETMLAIKSGLEEIAKDSSNKQALQRIIKTIEKSIDDDENWEQFTQHFDQVHGDFLKRLKEDFPDITPQETRLAAYLRMNLSSKNIAQLSNISVRGVEISRYRLRKKLNLEREVNLTSYLMDY